MYTRQDKHQAKIGYGGYGNFGQVPSATVTVTLGSAKVSLTGPAHETGVAASLVALLNSAVTGAKKGQHLEAQAALANAKKMLPTTGSLRGQVEPLIAAAEREVSAIPVFSAPTRSGMSTTLLAGLGGLAVLGALMALKRK